MIDTTTTKFKKDLKNGWVEMPKNWRNQSKQKQKILLEKLRGTRVVGGCSQDSRPRTHAINIAMVSAEAQDWKVFLRAHLDVMNDRFDRVSDGSYAWSKRKTYIKELEEININVIDLILGISFRINDPSSNHYFGSIGRLGRSLAETNNKEIVEKELFALMNDKELDLYNRLIVYFILDHYIHNLKAEKELKTQKLKLAVKKLPSYISEKIKI